MPASGFWRPTAHTKILVNGFAALYGGPRAAKLAQHSHAEVQVTVRFGPETANRCRTSAVSLFASQQPHAGGWEEGWQVVVFHLSPDRLEEAAQELVPGGRFAVRAITGQADGVFEEMARVLLHEFQRSEHMSRFYVDSVGHVLAGHILRKHCETQSHPSLSGRLNDKQMRVLRGFIHERIETGFSVSELAYAIGLRPHGLAQKLRTTTGLSPWRYVQAYRLALAQRMLASSRVDIAEIADKLGFASQSHFTNTFRNKLGLSPNAYRKLR
jgi:AraC family transcriptional regulator